MHWQSRGGLEEDQLATVFQLRHMVSVEMTRGRAVHRHALDGIPTNR